MTDGPTQSGPAGHTRWGKAGERLSPGQAAARDRTLAEQRNRAKTANAAMLNEARRAWEQGLIVPHRITTALDLRSLYGPEVDAACGAKEPDVDLWEEGKLYPTWEQLLLLAELTEVLPTFFFREAAPLDGFTSLDLHIKNAGPRKEPVMQFSHTALVMAGIRKADHRYSGVTEPGALF